MENVQGVHCDVSWYSKRRVLAPPPPKWQNQPFPGRIFQHRRGTNPIIENNDFQELSQCLKAYLLHNVRRLDCLSKWSNVEVLYIPSLIPVLARFSLKCFTGKGLKGFFIANSGDLE